ncbi:MAG: cobalt-precorrin 5A hydrolase [Bacillota bacterium]
MKKAVISITKGGYKLSKELNSLDSSFEVFTLKKFTNKDNEKINSLKDFINKKFKLYDILVFIMATGIVVRLIKNLINDKLNDPGIIVMDQNKNNVISLLSGHIGKANEYCLKIAKLLKSNPVITTASDNLKRESIDMYAYRNNFNLLDYEKAKDITAMIVNGKSIGIIDNYDGIVNITNKSVNLYKKNIIIGIGCKKNSKAIEIIKFIYDEFNKKSLSTNSIKKIASIDLKKNELGIKKASDFFDTEFITFSTQEVKKVENRFEQSNFVKKIVGVGCVSEPCGYLASNKGKKLLDKKIKKGITLSIWEEKNE